MLRRLNIGPLSSRVRLFGLLAIVGFVVSACASDAKQTTLDPKGPAARTIDNLSDFTFILAGIVFILVEFGVVFVAWKFRKRKDDDGSEVTQVHGHTLAELGWTALPALILVGMAIPTVGVILDLAEKPEDAIHVRVVGNQWWWSYDYDLDGDGVWADDDVTQPGVENPEEYATDVETANDLVIPVGVPVYLDIESRDVIHSYWIPALNGKKDAVPGRTHHLTIEADEPGTFVGQCTEFCGLSHAYMRMTVTALPQDEYDAWIENQLAPAVTPTDELALAGQEIFQGQCTTCHKVDGMNDDYVGADQVSSAAPNLSHFASRGTYAGGIFDLWVDLDGDGIVESEEIGVELERNQLEAWLRNPGEEKAMSPDDKRGMPDLGLSEADIDALVAYLTGLE